MALCEQSAGVRERERAHVHQYGTLIPHQFMADVLAYVGHCLRADAMARGVANQREIAAIVDCLEQGLAQGDRETRNAVALSFACDAETEDFFHLLRPLLGPCLRAQLKHG